jgi:hypothetical protein
MDDFAKRLYDKYVEDIVALIGLQKIVTFVIFVLVIIALSQKGSYSIWIEALNLPLATFIDLKGKFWGNLAIMQIVIAIVLSSLTGCLYTFLKSRFFIGFSKIKNPESYLNRLRAMILKSLTGNKEVDLAISQEWSEYLPVRKRKIIRLHILGEIYLSVSIASLLSAFLKKYWIDFGISLLFFSFTSWIQWKSYLYFLEKIVPLAMPKDLLLGINSSSQELFSSSASED